MDGRPLGTKAVLIATLKELRSVFRFFSTSCGDVIYKSLDERRSSPEGCKQVFFFVLHKLCDISDIT